MGRGGVQVEDLRLLDEPTGVHHAGAVGHVGHDAEIVGDEDQAHLPLLLQVRQQLHDLSLHGDVERGRRLVGDEHRRVQGDRHRDHDALAHATGELVWIGLDALPRGRNGDTFHEPHRTLEGVRLVHPAVLAEHLGDLPPDREDGVESRQRVLEDHRDLRATGVTPLVRIHRQQVAAAVPHLPGRDLRRRHVEDAHDGLGGHRLARSRLTQDGEGLALAEIERHTVDGLGDALLGVELDIQVIDLEQAAVLWDVLRRRC